MNHVLAFLLGASLMVGWIFIFNTIKDTISKSFGKFLENVWDDIQKTLYEKKNENV